MTKSNRNLHGNVPDVSATALLLLDVISDFEFPDSEQLFPHGMAIVSALTTLKAKAREAGIPAIYVNDNFGRWTSDFRRLLEHCLCDGVRGEPIARALAPLDDDYSVLKPKHSGFFGTTLGLVLKYLRSESLIITGFTTDICVAFTAADAYMREYRLWIPSDCTASVETRHKNAALSYMERVLRADVRPSTAVDLRTFHNSRHDSLRND
ncbi:MAG TPA: isochorismatase family cysteine hydrolase [Candidatus Binataceae bacterium]|nr:isochorismatase family cysteine hydrolase [Candidatus Binataceae bacterium]